MSGSTAPDPVDKKALYGRYLRGELWRDDLSRKVAHKALDIVDGEDMQVDNSRRGMGWKELSVIGGVILGGCYLIADRSAPPAPAAPAATAPAANPELQPIRGKIRFWVDDDDPAVTLEKVTPP